MTGGVRTWLAAGGVVALVGGLPGRLQAQQESLTAARQLYASAEYNEALTMLNGLLTTSPSAEDRPALELYRTLCLVALGSASEATRAIEAMIARDPLYRPDSEDVPPRLRQAFSDARRRLLPSIIQQKYVMAKAAFDQRDLAGAAEGFQQVLTGLSDPDIAPVVEQPPLADLRLLAAGFHDLAAKAIAMAAPPAPVEAPPPPAPLPEAPVSRTPRIYSVSDTNVVPPVTLRQVMPPYPGKILLAGTAALEVVIDENGMVESATMDTPLNPSYDRLALGAAKAWQYRPATLEGVPVKFRKRVQVTLVPNDPNR